MAKEMTWPDIPELWSLSKYFGDRWECIYQGLDVQAEIGKMAEWLEANPRRRPRNYKRFMVKWLNRAHGNMQQAELVANLKQRQAIENARFRP